MARALAPNSASIRAFVPHSDGEAMPAGGGTYRPTTRNSSPMKLSGVQLARPMRPPGRTTRRSSLAARSGLGANITPNVESATSNVPSANGRSSASATRVASSNPSASARRAPSASSVGT
jgi:hypothetical protein